ncbi:MAG: molybdenum cofactor guanylyltransferase [Erythrobacter sp.]|jgi:molybdopterin-guanine dinucleotide biosynthesis protein A
MILGVVLAGGRSARFGSDKALARLGGQTLLERALAGMDRWCDAVVVVGRASAPVRVLSDWPGPEMGPLAGIAAGLRHAQAEGFTSILTCGVDSIDLPDDLLDLLGPPPAYIESQPVVGRWPVAALEPLAGLLNSDGRHSMRAFAEAIAARPVRLAREPANINTVEDLAAAEQRHGL